MVAIFSGQTTVTTRIPARKKKNGMSTSHFCAPQRQQLECVENANRNKSKQVRNMHNT